MKITYAAAISEDGFIAAEDGSVAWLDDLKIDPDETGLEAFFASVGGLIMGRHTYDFIFDYGSWPYEDKPTWVCTSRSLESLEGANLTVVSHIADAIAAAAAQGLQHLWLVGGGQLASSVLQHDWLTHLSLSEMPVRLGAGIPLFSAHRLNEIETLNRQEVQKKGFRQIEITIRETD